MNILHCGTMLRGMRIWAKDAARHVCGQKVAADATWWSGKIERLKPDRRMACILLADAIETKGKVPNRETKPRAATSKSGITSSGTRR